MLYNDLIDTTAKKFSISKRQATEIVSYLTETLKNTMAKGDTLNLPGFGKFCVSYRSARKGRNPKTGESLKIAAKAVPAFKPASVLKGLIQKKVKAKPAAKK